MSYSVFIYESKTVREVKLPASGTITDSAAGLTFENAGAGVRVKGAALTERVLSAGEISRVTETLSVSVFERLDAPARAISLSGHATVTVGRSSSCDIRLNTRQVSGSHAVFTNGGGGWAVKDSGSTNGTYVNGKLINAANLRDGDIIFMGGWQLTYADESLSFVNRPGEYTAADKLKTAANRPARQADAPDEPYPFFQKSPRIKHEAAFEEVEILSPPSAGSKPTISWLTVLLPPIMMSSVMAIIALIPSGPGTTSLLYTVPMSLISVVIAVVSYNAQTKKWRESSKLAGGKYDEHIKAREAEIAAAETAYLNALNETNPNAARCAEIAAKRQPRLWERSVGDEDFLTVRIGTGIAESNVTIKIPQEQLTIEENPLLAKAREVQSKHRSLNDSPVVNAFADMVITGISGSRAEIIKMARSILVSVAAHHSYEDVKIVCVYPESEKRHWEWVRWLPHVWNDDRTARYISCSPAESDALLRELGDVLKTRGRNEGDKKSTASPWYFVVLADKSLAENSGAALLPDSRDLGFSVVLAYGETAVCNAVIECGSRECSLFQKASASRKTAFHAEDVSSKQADDFARSLAPVRFKASKTAKAMPTYVTFMQGINAGKVDDLDILGRWSKSRPFDSLAAPIGIRENGEVFSFDINDKAMGPHGLVGATTNWGKTKLLNTYVLSVALHYNPIEVNFVLVDFKGTDLGRGLTNLPHIAGRISNINDISLIDRNLRSLKGELTRRQKLFAATNIENIHKYQEAFRSGRVTEPLAYLLLIIDEFAEMKTKFPDKMEDIIQIARIGRALGVYMTLATQSPNSSIISGQVEDNTRFRICLKTAGAEQSKAMIGTADAFGITSKGRAIVKVGDNEVYEQVQTFYADADYIPEKSGKPSAAGKIFVVETNGERSRPEVYDKSVGVLSSPFSEGVAVANFIKSMADRSGIPKARQVWTEALPEQLSLNELISERRAFIDGAWQAKNEGFAVVTGLVDDPDNQTQYPLTLDFAANGHVAVYGAPLSGKTSFVQTVLTSAAYSYTPEQAEFAIFDFGNYALRTFEQLPHTRLVADSGDADKLKQAEEFILAEVERRKRLFAAQGAGSVETYRAVSGMALPYMLIVADNMAAIAAQSPDLAESLAVIARDGGGVGVFLLVTAGGSGSSMYRIAQNIKVSVALQLTDKTDYRQYVGGDGRQEPTKLPGRGFIKGPLEFQAALFADCTEAERIIKLREVCAAMKAAWKGGNAVKDDGSPASGGSTAPVVSAVGMESDGLTFNADMVEIGVDKSTFAPFAFDFREMSGCVISGAPKSGKTNALAHIAAALDKDADTRVYIYERGAALSNLCPNAKTARDGAAFDAFAGEIADEYDERTENNGDTPRIAIIIDGFHDFFSDIAEATVTLLDPIINYGEDYGIYTYIADDTEKLIKLRFMANPLSNALSFGRGIALGGKLKEHAVFDGYHKSENITLAANETAVIRGGKVSRVKMAKHKGVADNA